MRKVDIFSLMFRKYTRILIRDSITFQRNPDGEEGQSAADDGASLFEEFSDSLTELRVGQKLYQR